MKNKMMPKTKMKIKISFRFCFHFVFHFRFCFCFCFLKVLAFLLTPLGQKGHRRSTVYYLAQNCYSTFVCEFCTQPNCAIDVQLSLVWPRSVIALLLTSHCLEVPEKVKCLLRGLELLQHFHLQILLVAQRCHRWSTLT